MRNCGISIVKIEELKEHEKIIPIHLKKLRMEIENDGFLKDPIVCDKNTKIILDGHHRYESLRQLGCSRIAVHFVDYNSSEVKVSAWRKGGKIAKENMIISGLTGNKLRAKTSKHIILNKPTDVYIPLEELQ
jgi:hypothetical protein